MILNHNRKEYTNRVYNFLKPYATSYDVEIFDNGSTIPEEVSEYTTYRTEQNCYFGGGLNLTMELFLESKEYDSLLFMSNDIILHGYRFVDHLRDVMFTEDFALVSPVVIQPEETQCFWPTMHNWAAPKTRQVPWVDFMCPLIRRDVVEAVYPYSSELLYGWGQDIYTGIVCGNNGWKVGVTDRLSVVHFSAQTTKDNKADITLNQYTSRATQGMMNFFSTAGLMDRFHEMRSLSKNYTYSE